METYFIGFQMHSLLPLSPPPPKHSETLGGEGERKEEREREGGKRQEERQSRDRERGGEGERQQGTKSHSKMTFKNVAATRSMKV